MICPLPKDFYKLNDVHMRKNGKCAVNYEQRVWGDCFDSL